MVVATTSIRLTGDFINRAQTLGLISAQPGQKRKVSTAMLSTPSNSEATSSISSPSSSPSASVSFKEFTPTDEVFHDLPLDLVTTDMLEYLGFTEKAAAEVFDEFLSDDDDSPSVLFEYAVAKVRSPVEDGLGEVETLRAVGLSEEFIKVHTDPADEEMRWQWTTVQDLAVDTIKSRWSTVGMVIKDVETETVRKEAETIRIERRRGRASSSSGMASSTTPASSSTQTQTPDISKLTINSPDGLLQGLPKAHTKVATRSPPKQGFVRFYKGASWSRVTPLMNAEGQFNNGSLVTGPGGDFNHDQTAVYWTRHEDVAEKHRWWAAKRNRNGKSCAITVDIEEDWLVTLKAYKNFAHQNSGEW